MSWFSPQKLENLTNKLSTLKNDVVSTAKDNLINPEILG
jgi:hypothetical protein